MPRRRTVTFLAQLPRCRMSSRDSTLVSHPLPERELLLVVKVGCSHPPTLNTNARLFLPYCPSLQDNVASIFGGPGAHSEVWEAPRIPCADDAGKSRAAAPQNRSAAPGDGGDVDVGQPSVRVATHSMSNGPLTHGTPAGVGAAPPQEAPGSSPKHAHWHLPRPHLRLPFRGGQPAVDDVRSPPSFPVWRLQLYKCCSGGCMTLQTSGSGNKCSDVTDVSGRLPLLGVRSVWGQICAM